MLSYRRETVLQGAW